jgi:hypothetical protein
LLSAVASTLCSDGSCIAQALAAEWKELSEPDRLPYALRAAERTASAPPRPAKAPKAKAPKKRAARSSSPDLDFEHESFDADTLDGEFGAGPAPAKKRAGVDAHGFDWCVCAPPFSAASCADSLL